jgi:hypothetical protein
MSADPTHRRAFRCNCCYNSWHHRLGVQEDQGHRPPLRGGWRDQGLAERSRYRRRLHVRSHGPRDHRAIALTGFTGFYVATAGLVTFLLVLLVVAEPLRNLGKYTLADVLTTRFNAEKSVPRRRSAR